MFFSSLSIIGLLMVFIGMRELIVGLVIWFWKKSPKHLTWKCQEYCLWEKHLTIILLMNIMICLDHHLQCLTNGMISHHFIQMNYHVPHQSSKITGNIITIRMVGIMKTMTHVKHHHHHHRKDQLDQEVIHLDHQNYLHQCHLGLLTKWDQHLWIEDFEISGLVI